MKKGVFHHLLVFPYLAAMLSLYPNTATCARLSTPYLKFTPTRIVRGGVALITFTGPKNVTPEKIKWKNTTYPFFKNENGKFQAIFGLPPSIRHRRQFLTLVTLEGKIPRHSGFALMVIMKKYPVRILHLKKQAKFDTSTLDKIKKERNELLQILNRKTLKKLWKGKFVTPVHGKITSPFGVHRKINGSYISIHRGVDFRAPMKTPVRAINSGKVVFAQKMVLSGLTIVIDHGLGLYSLYGHLSQTQVSPGAFVKRGDVIGLSGNTGRSTGPHLHLGVTVSGIAVDPLSLIHLPL